MRHISYYVGLSTLLIFIFSACQSSTTSERVSVIGTVVNSVTGDPVNEAIVDITAPEEFSGLTQVTDANGQFTFSDLDVTASDRLPSYVPDTVRVPPMLTFVLIATLTALRFKLFGLSIVGVPDAPIRLISFTPKPFSAILLF